MSSFIPSYLQSPDAVALLDSLNEKPASASVARLDAAEVAGSAQTYALQTIALKSAAAVQQWTETDDLDQTEGPADRLLAMLIGVADEDKDGELSEEEQTIVQMAMNSAWDYMAGNGVAEDDLDAMFNSDDPEAANAAGSRVMEFLADAIPSGDEAADDMDDFAFDPSATEAVFDAVYKKRFAVRGGKKVVVRKRVSGAVRLTAKQKVAVRKMLMKSHGSKATMKRAKSLRVRKSMGMK